MRRLRAPLFVAWMSGLWVGHGEQARAAVADAGSARAAVRPDAGAAPRAQGDVTGDPHAGLGLPPGHPALSEPDDGEEGDDEELPPGHQAPRSGPPQTLAEDRLPEDTSEVDSALPAGVIVVEVRDVKDLPVPRADVTLGILQQSVAKGESRRRTNQTADEAGLARFEGLESGGGVAYRVTIPWGNTDEPATYAALPFQLDLHRGQRVRLHVYPVTHQINEALVGMEGILYIELKDDALQFDEFFRVYNLGAVTWVPQGVVAQLPRGFKAFTTQREMSDTGFDEAPGEGAKMRGTYSPGRHETHFRFQLPYDGSDSVNFSFTLPPRVAQVRVIAEASKDMTLAVDGFVKAVPDRNQRGQRVLITERKVRAGEPGLTRLRVGLDNIPTEGSAKWVATGIAAAAVALGLYLAVQQEGTRKEQRDPHDAERARARLIAEIAALERAHRAGEVGPKAYTRIHEALIDSLARLMPG